MMGLMMIIMKELSFETKKEVRLDGDDDDDDHFSRQSNSVERKQFCCCYCSKIVKSERAESVKKSSKHKDKKWN